MLSHDNLTWTAHCMNSQFAQLGVVSILCLNPSTITSNFFVLPQDFRVVSYLPLSHIASQLMVRSTVFSQEMIFSNTVALWSNIEQISCSNLLLIILCSVYHTDLFLSNYC